MQKLKDLLQKMFNTLGYKITPLYDDLNTKDYHQLKDFRDFRAKCRPYTMTSDERMYGLYEAVRYVAELGLEGEMVECGVWKGGSAMLMAYTLQARGVTDKEIYLYDTYEGMSAPTEHDVDYAGKNAASLMETSPVEADNVWCAVSLEEVKANLAQTGYPQDKLVFVKGKVEDTLPATIPQKIAVLRVDTDFYESTKHCLEQLFPRLVPGGVLILDDYGHWAGAQKAVDEYLRENKVHILLNRVDYTGRVG